MYHITKIIDIMAHSGVYACSHKAQWILERLPTHFTAEQVLLLDSLTESYSVLSA